MFSNDTRYLCKRHTLCLRFIHVKSANDPRVVCKHNTPSLDSLAPKRIEKHKESPETDSRLSTYYLIISIS